jgi:hypothetical protein
MIDLINTNNPEAGFTPQPTDTRENLSILRAGEKSLKRFPYYILRYGSRGKRFTYSDSGFILSLVNTPIENVITQIKWLGKLLSNRGIPQFLLENHLELLFSELITSVPNNYDKYIKLNKAAEHIKDMRIRIIPEDIMLHLNKNFTDAIGDEWSRHMYGCGMIIISAVIDEKLGIKNSVDSVLEWMTDSSRFVPEWINEVGDLFEKTRYYVYHT